MDHTAEIEALKMRVDTLEKRLEDASAGTVRKSSFFKDFFLAFFIVLSVIFWGVTIYIVTS